MTSRPQHLINWLVPQRVIYSRALTTQLSLEDLQVESNQIITLVEQMPAPQSVAVFLDATIIKNLPSPLDAVKVSTFMQHPDVGILVIGGVNNPLISFFSRFMVSVTQKPVRVSDTVPKALSFLMKQDPTLPDLITLYQDTYT